MQEILKLREVLYQISLVEEIMFGALVMSIIEAVFIGSFVLLYLND